MNLFFILATPPCSFIVFYYSCKDIFAPASLENTPTHCCTGQIHLKNNYLACIYNTSAFKLRIQGLQVTNTHSYSHTHTGIEVNRRTWRGGKISVNKRDRQNEGRRSKKWGRLEGEGTTQQHMVTNTVTERLEKACSRERETLTTVSHRCGSPWR